MTKPSAPRAPKIPTIRSFHGREFVDDYEWMRDKDKALEFLNASNTHAEESMAHLGTLSQNLYDEVLSRIHETDMSLPSRGRGYWYFFRIEKGENYGRICRVPAGEGWIPPQVQRDSALPGEQVIFDLEKESEGQEFFSLGAATVTDSGRYLAYSLDVEGNERYTLRIRDLSTGEDLDDVLENISSGCTWVGEEYIFYETVDDAWRPDSVWRHRVGTPRSEDVRVFHEPDERFWVGVGLSVSDKYLLIGCSSKVTSEYYYLPADDPEGEFRLIREREEGVDYDLTHAVVGGEDMWIVTHNKLSPNYSCGLSPVGKPLDLGEELMAHSDEARITGAAAYRDFLLLGRMENGLAKSYVKRGEGDWELLHIGDEELSSTSISGGSLWEAPVFRAYYTTYTNTPAIYAVDVKTDEKTLLKQEKVRGGYDPSQYESRRLWVPTPDGKKIPVSIVQRRDLDPDVPHPTHMTGYGAYEVSSGPAFSSARVSLLDRGIRFVEVHVRGGGEMGRLWYDNGKGLNKKHTFEDFITVADYLIDHGYTTPAMLGASGGSAGGLLMGAVANMGGDRFKAIRADVPFVDPLTSMLKPELPLTVTEWDEWGDPYHEADVYDYMASYAPYENVEAKPYPSILATTSLNDTRVLYVEPAKWIAKLREVATAGEFLLRTEMVAGHGGVSGRYDAIRRSREDAAWLVNQITGLTK
ncbi:S9 family peptidase [Corynebacterium glucuronolyticum]|uniref:S9 family peptidase n=1 Tax=Corynebacterium glucuronolyticum TaxID=39791 RepID=UPI00019C20E6|nr:S9 family peptidase [Corynebacterium glucuronolyticum]EEI25923.1 peptidase, S9A/B/C family, catalytic domain protein [Corynebacterium glucuronolyticum ATCC 51867]QRO82578.1 S9 family peptidase [Corynebacterium glucuronolyticum]